MIQNDRQADLELDLEINQGFQRKFTIPGRHNIRNISETTDKSQIVDPPELTDLVNTDKDSSEIFTKTGRYR